MKIFGHMLLLNEETFIEHSIVNLAKTVDKCVVADMGSTDKTLEILEELNLDNVLIYKFNQNCDRYKLKQHDMRNWINEECTRLGADYVFVQDGDELLDYDLHKLIETNPKDYYSFMFYDVVFRKYIKPFGIHNHVRLYKSNYITWIHQRHSDLTHNNVILNKNDKNFLVDDVYFFHLHRFNNKAKRDEGEGDGTIWGNDVMEDFPQEVVLSDSLLKFWEAKGI